MTVVERPSLATSISQTPSASFKKLASAVKTAKNSTSIKGPPLTPDIARRLRADRVLTRPYRPRIIPIRTRSSDAEMRSNLFGITGFGPGLARPKADAPVGRMSAPCAGAEI